MGHVRLEWSNSGRRAELGLTTSGRPGRDRRSADAWRKSWSLLALNGVDHDVLAERSGSTRGALYKTLHDARAKLRTHAGDLLEVIE